MLKLALVYLTGPVISDDFVSPTKEQPLRVQIFWGMGGVRGRNPRLGEGTGCPVRLAIFFNPPKRRVQFRTPVSSVFLNTFKRINLSFKNSIQKDFE
jgi:hypothetical protein